MADKYALIKYCKIKLMLLPTVKKRINKIYNRYKELIYHVEDLKSVQFKK